jgi:hypothetical protein
MGKITRIDDGERIEVEKRTAAEIQESAEVIDLEDELHKTKTTSEDIRWSQTGRHHFKRMIDSLKNVPMK